MHLWNNGQVQQSSNRSGTDDTLEEELNDDADSASPDVITSFDEKALKDPLLDRVAEVASNAKGGRYVAASVMHTGNGWIELIIARNEGFHSSDERFFRDLELIVRHIATHGGKIVTSVSAT
ncbi:Uu.00g141130.m01.CDS01 [Anthostomella pinea]|uniref:Uu.00g141130.m01.CDS01 n=1 Tax=Anthostomella pinea TaxID=933095 RepID=A0AAI8VRE1_9PEZI|nr:Uu.00g141130.m01.CDS01 [Anthostomella pinea]